MAGHSPASGPVFPQTTSFELIPHALTIDGKAVARLADGRVCFLDRGLPGQKVLAEITAEKGRWCEGRRLEILAEAPEQVAPFCPHFGECGGCDWQDLDYAGQLHWKQRFVLDALTRIAGAVSPQVSPTLPSPVTHGFRNKMEFAFGTDARGELHLGLRRRASHEIIPVSTCPVAAGPEGFAGRLLAAARHLAAQSGLPAWPVSPEAENADNAFWRFLVLRAIRAEDDSAGAFQLHVQCITAPHKRAGAVGEAFLEGLMAALPEITGASHAIRAARPQIAYGEKTLTRLGRQSLIERIGPVCLELAPDAFFQTNSAATLPLYEEIRRMAALTGTETVWDMYGGVGGIALFLAAGAAQVLGFELSEAATAAARANARLNDAKNCRFMAGDVRRLLKKDLPHPDLVVVDPPRAGLHKDVTGMLLALAPHRIIHVGCDPAAQARDIGRFLSGGYSLVEARPVDLFPHAAHVESVALLERAS